MVLICNIFFRNLLVSTKTKKVRYTKQYILIEGKRLIKEALKAKVKPVMIVFSRKNLAEGLPLDVEYCTPEKTILRQMPYKDMKIWSNLTTSPGLFGMNTLIFDYRIHAYFISNEKHPLQFAIISFFKVLNTRYAHR